MTPALAICRRDARRYRCLVFGTQALGLIVGRLIALALLGGGLSGDTVWRVLPSPPRRSSA